MEKNKKKFVLMGTVASGVIACMGVALLHNSNIVSNVINVAHQSRGDNNSLVISSTSLVTSPTFTNGSFYVATNENNNIKFVYDEGKSNANGLITLDKTYNGNPFASHCYVGNDDPITSTTKIDVTFKGGRITVFASNDKVTYHKVDILESNGESASKVSMTLGYGYLYYQFANGNQYEGKEIDINSIEFTYSCLETDYSVEASDMTEVFTLNGAAAVGGGVALDTSTHFDAFNGRESLKFTSPVTVNPGTEDEETYVMNDSTSSRWQFGIHLPRKMKGSELYNMKLSMKCESSLTSKGDNKTVELRIYPSTKYWSYENSSLCVRVYPSAGHEGWYDLSVNFSASSISLNSDTYKDTEFQYLFIRPNHVAPVGEADYGYLFIDEMRLDYVNDYPEFDSSEIDESPEEKNDISNGSYINGYSATDEGLNYLVKSTSSYRSRAVNPSGDTCRFNLSGLVDYTVASPSAIEMAGKTIQFDVKLGPSNAYVQFNIYHLNDTTDTRYTIDCRYGTETGVTKTVLENGWVRWVINCSVAITKPKSTSGKDKTSIGDYGFNIAHSTGETVYFDNIFVYDTPAE